MESHEHWKQKFNKKIERRSRYHIEYYFIQSVNLNYILYGYEFFDMLWRKAIPAKQRIKEIGEGLKREFIETIQDPEEIQILVSKVISSNHNW
jgi:hypothetical protein